MINPAPAIELGVRASRYHGSQDDGLAVPAKPGGRLLGRARPWEEDGTFAGVRCVWQV